MKLLNALLRPFGIELFVKPRDEWWDAYGEPPLSRWDPGDC